MKFYWRIWRNYLSRIYFLFFAESWLKIKLQFFFYSKINQTLCLSIIKKIFAPIIINRFNFKSYQLNVNTFFLTRNYMLKKYMQIKNIWNVWNESYSTNFIVFFWQKKIMQNLKIFAKIVKKKHQSKFATIFRIFWCAFFVQWTWWSILIWWWSIMKFMKWINFKQNYKLKVKKKIRAEINEIAR